MPVSHDPSSPETRTETDSLGAVQVPAAALWGAQTQRAVAVYAISGRRMPRAFIAALGRVKHACAGANHALGQLDADRTEAIQAAAAEVISGDLDDHFPVDVFQTGSGTASNMNANEVISNRAIQALGGTVGSKDPVHPNDHVNMGQSSNDVIPTAIHVAGAVTIDTALLPALHTLHDALAAKAAAYDHVVKSGRTHLMDATPVRLGQEIGGWAAQVRHGIRRAEAARDALLELALGGTAVGTGLNRPPALPGRAIAAIAEATGLPFREAADHFEAQGARDGVVEAHGQLETIAASLFKIASDVRLLASGPRTGFGELSLPALAPGSSIMPGKVNPVMAEMLTQVCARVLGNGCTIKAGGMSGQLQLNVFLPVMAEALLDSITLLSNGARAFALQAVAGMTADEERCRATVERNLALGTALAPAIGYDEAAAIAKQAWKEDRSVREVATDRGVLPAAELDRLLDPRAMTEPG